MIFTLKQRPDRDVFAFFTQDNSISISKEDWVLAVFTSLRMKKPVFILEEHQIEPELPLEESRWKVSTKFLYLSTRSGRVLLEAAHLFSNDYKAIKVHLNTFK